MTVPAGDAGGESPSVHDEVSAAAAIEGLLDLGEVHEDEEEGGEHQSEGREPDETGDEETRPTGDDEDEGHSDEPAKPAPIEPPKSLTAEEKEAWAKLPPEAQKIIARRESDAEKAFTTKTQEIAEERKAFEAERAAITAQRTQYLQSLQALVHMAVPEAEAFAKVNWDQLATENPAAWAQLSQQRDSLRQRVGAITAEIQRVQQAQGQELAQSRQKLLQAQHAELVKHEPDFADQAKGAKLGKDLSDYLQSQWGFTPEEIGSVGDNRLLRLALYAMRQDSAEKARATAQTKRANTPPRAQRAGTPQGSDSTASQRALQANERLKRSGDVRDAAMLIENFL